MNRRINFLFFAFFILLTPFGCLRDDDEPVYPTRPISRLYVSIESYQSDVSKDPLKNVVLIDPADTSVMSVALNYNAGAVAGAGIYFNPFVSRVFQAGYTHNNSLLDTTIRVMQVGRLGVLSYTGSIGHEELVAMRGLVYHHPSDMLYVANNSSPTAIYGFYQPMNKNGFTKPNKVLRLGSEMRPWGMVLWNDSLLVSNSGTNGGVSLYGGISKTDSLEENFQALSTIRIEGAMAIRGIAFVDSLDILVAVDYGLLNENNERITNGEIYVIEGVKGQLAASTGTVTPTRIISGMNTGLVGPVDVAIDPRGEKDRRTIYIADRDARKISRFKLSEEGNVAPEATLMLDDEGNLRRPFGLFLDVRGETAEYD